MRAPSHRPPEPVSDRLALTGVASLGLFLALHVVPYAAALWGRDTFDAVAGLVLARPGVPYVEAVLTLVPLAVHAGANVLRARRPAAGAQGVPDWLRRVRVVSGVGALAFVAAHLWRYHVARALGATPWYAVHGMLSADLIEPRWFAPYYLGVTAAVFHFASGAWLLAPRRSPRWFAVAGFALWALAANTAFHFGYRCGGVVPLPAQDLDATCHNTDLGDEEAPAR